jgi:glycerol-3-phosphate acyltransferase PlsY
MLAGVSAVLLVAAVAGYAIGSVPVAAFVARRHGVDDLRTVGDRNPGFWNAMQLIGWRAALPIFVGDTAAGALGAVLGLAASDHWYAPYVCGGAAMVGHAFPVFAGFHGGRSVLAFVGTAAVVSPVAASICVGALLVVWGVGRRFDVAARVAVALFPAVQLAVEGVRPTAATGVLMTFVGLRFAWAARADGDDVTGSGSVDRAT